MLTLTTTVMAILTTDHLQWSSNEPESEMHFRCFFLSKVFGKLCTRQTLKVHLTFYVHGNFSLAISFWSFSCHICTWGTWTHIIGPILVIFGTCHFMIIPGPFEYFSDNIPCQKIKIFLMKEKWLCPFLFSLCRVKG